MPKRFLFSVDLEDARFRMPDGLRYPERAPHMTRRYLRLLNSHQAKATFFVVGDTARAFPDLIREIVAQGHEIACHSDTHTQLDGHTPASLRDDLRRNLDSLRQAGAERIVGFRAPTLSITPATAWAYDVLAELGFVYSSSVLGAPNPLYGWPGFGRQPRRMSGGIIEMPLTLARIGPSTLPIASGTYLRLIPRPLLMKLFASAAANGPVIGYVHPYDIDTGEALFLHPDVKGNRVLNLLLYYNRGSVFDKLEAVLDAGFVIQPHRTLAEELAQRLPAE